MPETIREITRSATSRGSGTRVGPGGDQLGAAEPVLASPNRTGAGCAGSRQTAAAVLSRRTKPRLSGAFSRLRG
jgi:hypothetical protein